MLYCRENLLLHAVQAAVFCSKQITVFERALRYRGNSYLHDESITFRYDSFKRKYMYYIKDAQ